MKVLKLLEGEGEKKVILQSSSGESIIPPPSPPSVNLKKKKTHKTKKKYRSRSTSNESSLTPVPSPSSKNSAIIKSISAQYLGVHQVENVQKLKDDAHVQELNDDAHVHDIVNEYFNIENVSIVIAGKFSLGALYFINTLV